MTVEFSSRVAQGIVNEFWDFLGKFFFDANLNFLSKFHFYSSTSKAFIFLISNRIFNEFHPYFFHFVSHNKSSSVSFSISILSFYISFFSELHKHLLIFNSYKKRDERNFQIQLDFLSIKFESLKEFFTLF